MGTPSAARQTETETRLRSRIVRDLPQDPNRPVLEDRLERDLGDGECGLYGLVLR
jgi:hypothetical protein